MKYTLILSIVFILTQQSACFGQNFNFNYSNNGRRVCLVSSEVHLTDNQVKIIFHDSLSNNSDPIFVYRRSLGTFSWSNVASNLAPGTGHWIDGNVANGDIWEYQIRRQNTWLYQAQNYDAIGYTIGAMLPDNSVYKGQMILLVADDIPANLTVKYERLKKEIVADGWLVNELIVAKATNWDSGNEVVGIKGFISSIYNNAPANDKPKALFILGHVPMPRSGSTFATAPDAHDQNKGARGCDAYYADIDGIYTDTATFNPGGLATPLAINLPGDFKWDQDFFPSDIEMAFGRVDFANLTDISTPELTLIENYLDRLSNYKNVAVGFDMGEKSAFNNGYDNSNDGSFRSLVNISKPDQVFENISGSNHNQWVQNNGPFKIYMQNVIVPNVSDWQNFGMDATVYSSDQSYWGFGDVPQPGGDYSRIRSLLGVDSKCLVTLWTTTGINIFHQACTGEALGIAMKEIMNHNSTNQYLEKAPQDFDTEEWWNRTHFAFHGDPTLNLYQVAPVSNLSIVNSNGDALLQWSNSPDPNILGYHVYESSSELGKFERITNSPLTGNSLILSNYLNSKWYIVKAVKVFTSGCGQFIQASLGTEIQGNLSLNLSEFSSELSVAIYPNPAADLVSISSPNDIKSIVLYSVMGEKVFNLECHGKEVKMDISHLPENLYIAKIKDIDGNEGVFKLVKSNNK